MKIYFSGEEKNLKRAVFWADGKLFNPSALCNYGSRKFVIKKTRCTIFVFFIVNSVNLSDRRLYVVKATTTNTNAWEEEKDEERYRHDVLGRRGEGEGIIHLLLH